jgi:uncharacterized protein YbcC (UPF0753/DUF2309 family)
MSQTAFAANVAPKIAASAKTPDIAQAIATACGRIAPLWPLADFVAVNPFVGMADMAFGEAAALRQRLAGTRLVMPRAFYADAITSGRISAAALAAAAKALGMTGAQLADAAQRPEPVVSHGHVVATVAETIDRVSEQDRRISLAGFMIDEISDFCAAYFDEGQALWSLPTRQLKPYAAWRELAVFDRNPECMGIKGFRATIRALPQDPVAAIAVIVAGLGIPERAIVDYLYRALLDIGGWAAYARHFDWPQAPANGPNDTIVGLLAIRLAYGYALFRSREDAAFLATWKAAMAEAADFPEGDGETIGRDLSIDIALQEAYETTWRQEIVTALKTKREAHGLAAPEVQAAFCIDVRSEPLRRALESVHPGIETIGFAGFFGLPLGLKRPDASEAQAQCPVLLSPNVFACEAVSGEVNVARGQLKSVWSAFKSSAVTSFAFVEALGIGLAAKLATATTRGLGLGIASADKALKDLALTMPLADRIGYAEAVFAGMSLKPPYARMLVLVGHASETTNNPHAASLACGACGGHSGEPNARLAARILNDAEVQAAVRAKGVALPEGWCAVAALHDTLSDRITICDSGQLPLVRADDIRRLEAAFAAAGAQVRQERAPDLGFSTMADLSAFLTRGNDWAQVRPEWGLAGNAAFLAAPRHLSAGLDLGGRVFLHTYDHGIDPDHRVLESILTAPLIVASWINLQYYGSSVDPAVFGSGNKTLHNVVGKLGVIEGNGGDLRAGLPIQSVHDGETLHHEPIRLQAFIAAPEAAIDAIVARQAHLHDLLANRWIFLHALSDDGQTARLWVAPGVWEAVF